MWKWIIWLRSTSKQFNENNQEDANKEFMEKDGWYGQAGKGKLKTERDCILSCPKTPHSGNVGKKGIWEEEGIWVDWDANNSALRATLIARRHWLTKQVSGMCGVGKMMKIWWG